MSGAPTWEQHYLNIDHARSQGFEIVYADDVTLLLDLDTREQKEQYERMKPLFLKIFGITQSEWRSKSGNRHVVLKLNSPMSLELRVGLQMALGSDPKRGFCEIQQIVDKANPIVLFKPKENLGKEKP